MSAPNAQCGHLCFCDKDGTKDEKCGKATSVFAPKVSGVWHDCCLHGHGVGIFSLSCVWTAQFVVGPQLTERTAQAGSLPPVFHPQVLD